MVGKAEGDMMFGEYFRILRTKREPSLRKFCQQHGLDAGNISKLESGKMAPPKSEERIRKLAKAVGLKKDTRDYDRFLELALSVKRLSRHQSSFANVRDEKIRQRLPDLLTRLNSPSLTEKKLEDLFSVLST